MANVQNIHRTDLSRAFKKTAPGGVVLKQLAPTAPDTKRLAARYGKALVYVPYRDDIAQGCRLTTTELIVDEWPLPRVVALRVAFDETDLRRQIKTAGGLWDAKRKLWQLPQTAVRKLKLQDRVVSEGA